MMKNLKKKKGFTLIELIIVIAILGIIAAIAIPKLTNTQDDAKIKADQANGKVIADAVSMALVKGTIKKSAGAYVGSGDTPVNYTANSVALSDAPEVVAELASVPKPKSVDATDEFHVQISATGDITVYRQEGGLAADKVYPQS